MYENERERCAATGSASSSKMQTDVKERETPLIVMVSLPLFQSLFPTLSRSMLSMIDFGHVYWIQYDLPNRWFWESVYNGATN